MVARREETPTVPSSEESVVTKLRRIAEKARKESLFKFCSLFHLMNEELLRGCFKRLRKDAAAGIDEETKETYAAKSRSIKQGMMQELLTGRIRLNCDFLD